MEWNLSPEQDAYQEAFRGWLADVAPPDVVRQWLDAGDAAAFEKLFADGGPELALAGETAAYLIPAECVPDEAPPLTVDETGAISGSVPRVLAGGTAVRFVVPVTGGRGAAAGFGAGGRPGGRGLPRRLGADAGPGRGLQQAAPPVRRPDRLVPGGQARGRHDPGRRGGGPVRRLLRRRLGGRGRSRILPARRRGQGAGHRRGARTADSALTLHGAIGYTWEYDLQLFFKRAKLDEKLLGTRAQWNERIAAGLALV